jgi:hypothetical protein
MVLVAACALAGGGGGAARAQVAFDAPMRVGGGGNEPGIDVSTAGTLFANEPGSAHPMWRLPAGSTRWTQTQFDSTVTRYPGGFDSDVATGHGARVYYLDLSLVSNTLLRSDDDGVTWTQGTPLTTLPVSDRQWLAVGPQDANGNETLYVVYALINPPFSTMFARSDDSGATWTTHAAIPGLGGNAGHTGQLVANDDGFVAVAYDRSGQMRVARSFDKGNTWDTVDASPYQDAFPGMIVGMALDGRSLHVAWVSQIDYSIAYARSDDLGTTWTFPQSITPPQGSAAFSWIAARGDKVAAAWYATDTPAEPTNPNKVPATSKWTVRYTESTDRGETFAPVVPVWTKTVQTGIICTNGISCTAGRQLGDFMQLLIEPSGRSDVVFASHSAAPNGVVVARQS